MADTEHVNVFCISVPAFGDQEKTQDDHAKTLKRLLELKLGTGVKLFQVHDDEDDAVDQILWSDDGKTIERRRM